MRAFTPMENTEYLARRKYKLTSALKMANKNIKSTCEGDIARDLAIVSGLQKLQNDALTSLYRKSSDNSNDMEFIEKYLKICQKR